MQLEEDSSPDMNMQLEGDSSPDINIFFGSEVSSPESCTNDGDMNRNNDVGEVLGYREPNIERYS